MLLNGEEVKFQELICKQYENNCNDINDDLDKCQFWRSEV
ncbi:hypothetical protein CRYO30217_00523 [Parvicella tangerina]|uniref:Uncharacterized protein n=1 Tax=Parvicella tangerina TaxID=2829795 RepID=A0A916NQ01_9FLAO|nr:hypothetical protein CRYO30217_00523 [Parvicella tangerina]